jgi:hypothetical protein
MLFAVDPKFASVELGAALLGVLAYPGVDPLAGRHRESFSAALVCLAIDEMQRKPQSYGRLSEALRLASKAKEFGTTERAFKNGARLINRERLIAAKMARPEVEALVREAQGEPPSPVPKHAGLEPLQEVVESDESVVIPCGCLIRRSARCGSQSTVLPPTAAAFVIPVT